MVGSSLPPKEMTLANPVGGMGLKAVFGQRRFARLLTSEVREGESVAFRLDLAKASVFDAESGLRVTDAVASWWATKRIVR